MENIPDMNVGNIEFVLVLDLVGQCGDLVAPAIYRRARIRSRLDRNWSPQ